MPRDGSYIYTQPFDDVDPDTTIESTVYNGFTHDIETDLNTPRPIIAGGTGGTSPTSALQNLGAETAAQVVTNFNSHLWRPGSFRHVADAADVGAPVINHAFAGICYINEAMTASPLPPTNANLVIEARDMSDTTVPGRLYVREKKAGVWSAWTSADYVLKAGDTMTGDLVLSYTHPTIVLRKAADGNVCQLRMQTMVDGTPKNRWLWRFSETDLESGANAGSSFALHRYDDAGTIIDQVLTIKRSDGRVHLIGNPTEALHATTKQYADLKVAKTGDTMTGQLNITNASFVISSGSASVTAGASMNGVVGFAVSIGYAGTAGYSVNDTGWGKCGIYDAGAYWSFYGTPSAYIAGGTWQTSDGRLKTVTRNVDPAHALAAVNAIAVKEYKPANEAARMIVYGGIENPATETRYGWIAQDIEPIIPIAVRDVRLDPDDQYTRAAIKRIKVPKRGSKEANNLGAEVMTVKAMNDHYMLTTLWAAVQQLSVQNDELRAELNALKETRK